MPRPPRPTHLDAIFHIWARGNDGQDIFRDAKDSQRFIDLLARAKGRLGLRLYAYCLMSNHLHLLLHVLTAPLSSVMQWLLTCYVSYFNRRWQRKGHLFQERFDSILCQNNTYFLELLRYIHLNPVRAKLVATPEEWTWSGHRELTGAALPLLIDRDFPLSLFHQNAEAARTLYAQFLREGIPLCHQTPDPFTQDRIAPENLCLDNHPGPLAGPSEADLREIAQSVSRESGVSFESIRGAGKTREVAFARRTLICRAIAGGHRPGQIVTLLRCTPSLISKALARAGHYDLENTSRPDTIKDTIKGLARGWRPGAARASGSLPLIG